MISLFTTKKRKITTESIRSTIYELGFSQEFDTPIGTFALVGATAITVSETGGCGKFSHIVEKQSNYGCGYKREYNNSQRRSCH